MQLIDIFSGVGGFSIAAMALGIDTKVFCEIELFPRAVLANRFPGIPVHDDARTLTRQKLIEYGWNPDDNTILTGGFPCQPFSVAGKRKGAEDNRFLWPEMLRLIKEAKPCWVIGENVGGFTSMDLDTGIAEVADQEGSLVLFKKVAQQVIDDLNEVGYDVPRTDAGDPILFVIPACAINAPHRRDRVWIIARKYDVPNSIESGCRGRSMQFNHVEPWGIQKCSKERSDLGGKIKRCYQSTKNSNSSTDGELQEPRSFGEFGDAGAGGNERHTCNAHAGVVSNTESRRIGKGTNSDCQKRNSGSIKSQPTSSSGNAANSYGSGSQEQYAASESSTTGFDTRMVDSQFNYWKNFPTQSPIYTGDDGLRSELVRVGCINPDRVIQYQRQEAIKAAGNAIVPWVAYEFFKAILSVENEEV